jgi:hypothetical protein
MDWFEMAQQEDGEEKLGKDGPQMTAAKLLLSALAKSDLPQPKKELRYRKLLRHLWVNNLNAAQSFSYVREQISQL